MTEWTLPILIFTLFSVSSMMLFWVLVLKNEARINQKYPLYAVRDEFSRLKINGYFDDFPSLYEFYCNICNALISNTNQIDFFMFLNIVDAVDEKPEFTHVRSLLQEAPNEIKVADMHLWQVVTKILIQNSTLLRLVLTLRINVNRASEFLMSTPVQNSYVTKPVKAYAEMKDHNLVPA